ncbi:MAG: hypothetical protein NT069_15845 [Planctomycetota bacterium]|nr:hypothetical protein [Planctomycetota bacterium]
MLSRRGRLITHIVVWVLFSLESAILLFGLIEFSSTSDPISVSIAQGVRTFLLIPYFLFVIPSAVLAYRGNRPILALAINLLAIAFVVIGRNYL